MTSAPALPPYLADGVRFACTDCGACCSGAPGRVRLRADEAERIAAFLGEELAALRARVTRVEAGSGQLLLREEANGDCIFFVQERCAIHPVKPKQCQLYPFWFKNVRSREAWERTRAECPGIGQGPLVVPDDILRQVEADLST